MLRHRSPIQSVFFRKHDLYVDSSASQPKNNASNLFLQLDFMFHRGLEAIRIMSLEGFNKSATFVNTAQSSEMLNRWQTNWFIICAKEIEFKRWTRVKELDRGVQLLALWPSFLLEDPTLKIEALFVHTPILDDNNLFISAMWNIVN